jgi:signal transduction histidine kinase
MSGHPSFEDQYTCWLNQENYFTKVSGEDLRARYALLRASISVPYLDREDGEHREHGYFFSFSEGQFYVWTREQYSDAEIALLGRFKTIVELTFRRYLDLQKAEAQAREAQIETSLERVRSRTLAMQKSDELAETAAVLFRQLITLGIAPNRLYIAILKGENGDVEFWITDEDGTKVSSGFAANLHANGTFQKMFDGWREGKRSLTIDMQGKELQEYFEHLASLNVPFKGGRSQLRRVQNIAFFSKGFIGIASPDEQPEETTLFLERFAAVFNLTLTRFNDLKLAEAQAEQAQRDLIQLQAEKKRAEDALTELRATQEQLVQQEKLASLGQLTAGIAHEIKNPLNFVNNFSSISVELVDEAIEEMNKPSPELRTGEISQLLSDVKINLTRVIEHGTRADGIVKSMLHHSRGGSGKSEPTDLNALTKEYVNLAFHGMRAGKNPINVGIEFDLDESTGKALLVAEDFSRVIVNICQNAFDAMREKVTAGEGGANQGSYVPKLSIRSRRNAQRITLEIEDNGPGIPDAIRDKVLQPFFTTKKGTQGTGLGLSITHDIVKAHRGDLNIERNGSNGATFTIGLPVEMQK